MDVFIENCSPSVDLSECVQLMPCGISHNGPAPVSSYFMTSIRKTSTNKGTESLTCEQTEDASTHEHLTSSFRGRPLNGCKVPLPSGYKGIVVEESRDNTEERFKPMQSDKTVEKWKILGDFQNLTYWNWDKMASDNDGVQGLFQWIRIARDMRQSPRADMEKVDCSWDSDTES